VFHRLSLIRPCTLSFFSRRLHIIGLEAALRQYSPPLSIGSVRPSRAVQSVCHTGLCFWTIYCETSYKSQRLRRTGLFPSFHDLLSSVAQFLSRRIFLLLAFGRVVFLLCKSDSESSSRTIISSPDTCQFPRFVYRSVMALVACWP
jgi:hypothetical protein